MSMFREAPTDSASGPVSMRRVLAFILALAGVASGILAVLMNAAWQVVAAAFGVPGTLAVVLLFFTTWTDIRGIIEAGAKCGK